MDELLRIVRVNYEVAVEKHKRCLDNDEWEHVDYYEGQADGLRRVLDAWEFLGIKEGK